MLVLIWIFFIELISNCMMEKKKLIWKLILDHYGKDSLISSAGILLKNYIKNFITNGVSKLFKCDLNQNDYYEGFF